MALSDIAFPEYEGVKYGASVEGIHKLFNPSGLLELGRDTHRVPPVGINCYTHGLGIADEGWGIPGQLLWSTPERPPRPEINVESYREKILEDGLIEVDWSDIDPLKGRFLSAVLRENEHHRNGDFHFYAWGRDGRCSQKQGHEPITWVTRELKKPKDVLINGYNQYIGTFKVPESGIFYHPK